LRGRGLMGVDAERVVTTMLNALFINTRMIYHSAGKYVHTALSFTA
jgi:hypothetical protein